MKTLAVGLVLLAGSAFGQKPARVEKQAARQAAQEEARAAKQAQQAQPILQRLMGMTPGQREKALSRLAPERRQQIEAKLRNLDQMPPAAQARLANRAEKLNAMPAARQMEVRQSLQRFNGLMPARRKVVQREVERIRQMNAEQREKYFASEEFKTRFPQPGGQKMVQNLVEIMPEAAEPVIQQEKP